MNSGYNSNPDSRLGEITANFFGKIIDKKTIEEYVTKESIDITSSSQFQQKSEPELYFDEIPEVKKKSEGKKNTFFSGSSLLSFIGLLIGAIPVILISFYFIFLLISLGWIPFVLILTILGLSLLIKYLPGWFSHIRSISLGCFGVILNIGSSVLFLLLIGWGVGSGLLRSCHPDNNIRQITLEDPIEEKNFVMEKDDEDLVDSKKLLVHKRVWKDYDRNTYEIDLIISEQEMLNSGMRRDNEIIHGNIGSLYRALSFYDEEGLKFIYKGLDSIKARNNLTRKEFAELVVSMVQDIPYKLILDTDCNIDTAKPRFANEYLANCENICCLGGIKYGLQTPLEFMGNLYGDCDTRTTTLYTLLKHYKYDVGILNSRYFAHSMIAINLPYSGDFYRYAGKNYYYWETTETGFTPGYINPEFNNPDYWDMVTITKDLNYE